MIMPAFIFFEKFTLFVLAGQQETRKEVILERFAPILSFVFKGTKRGMYEKFVDNESFPQIF